MPSTSNQPDVRARLVICKVCSSWAGFCQKGLKLASMMGCPEKKFPPAGNAGYAPNIPIQGHAASTCCGQGKDTPKVQNLKSVTPGDVARNFANSMVRWTTKGVPMVTSMVHSQRYTTKCRPCPHFKNHICTKCMCLAYLKTKLATEECPDDPPRWKRTA